MFSYIRRIFGLNVTDNVSSVELPPLDRSEIAHLFCVDHKLPHINWDEATPWIESKESDLTSQRLLRRAIASHWLDELRNALPSDHRRWANGHIEGIGPLQDNAADHAARAANKAYIEISRALCRLRGTDPIPPIAIIALATDTEYYSLISHHYPD